MNRYTFHVGAQPVLRLEDTSALEAFGDLLHAVGPAHHPRAYGDAVFAYLRDDSGELVPVSVLPERASPAIKPARAAA